MNIKEFVKESITQLSEALSEASTSTGHTVKLTNIPLMQSGKGNRGLLEFDLAISAGSETTTKTAGGVDIKVLSADLGTGQTNTSSSVSRLKFTVQADL